MTKPMPTLEDVAARARVSTATVSRCLNSPEKVVQSTRDRVMEAVEALGYSPHFGARIMAARRTHMIGAVIPTMANAIFARGLQTFQEELQQRGFHLMVASSSYQPDLEEAQVRSLVARGAEGLLLIGHDRAETTRAFLDQRSLPVIVAWAYDESAALPSVGFDNRASMKILAAHVIATGHGKIAMISAPTGENDRARDRVKGVRDAMADAGLDPEALVMIETDYGIANGATAFQQIMATEPTPTVVMCGNDVLAVGALTQARKMGLSVPDDVSITGFDDIEIAAVVDPPLTTVHVPHSAMGREAAQLLVGLIEQTHAPNSVALEARLVRRGSLGAPKSGSGA